DLARVEMLRGLLAQHGIESVVMNAGLAHVGGEVPFFLTGPELWVARDEDLARALEIVEQFESGAEEASVPREAWQCSKCGEMIEGQFTECWNCRLVYDADPREDPDAKCDECGYPLRGLPERRCPECGTDF
ncbi:MAG: DUF2007 domain-containing protein, partial [Planctomycetes bacterium]|nr:DUF2007 domain-containing protein [Planctomycetota bacterium]